ncbi:protein NYNRIN-like [Gordionus sp. m RMFG-2023]|uniref:protein NYNRIN-like n=1 Tax=Gordionus sp. m RMFG-2023 TaxID=3053472 RepID=UPI0031FE3B44
MRNKRSVRGKRPWREGDKHFKCIEKKLSIVDECLVRGNRGVVPLKLRGAVLSMIHAGHQGIERMKQWGCEYVWCPGMNKEIENICRGCLMCNSWASMPRKDKRSVWPKVVRPWERIHLDFLDFENKIYLLVVDAFSKWMEYEEVR